MPCAAELREPGERRRQKRQRRTCRDAEPSVVGHEVDGARARPRSAPHARGANQLRFERGERLVLPRRSWARARRRASVCRRAASAANDAGAMDCTAPTPRERATERDRLRRTRRRARVASVADSARVHRRRPQPAAPQPQRGHAPLAPPLARRVERRAVQPHLDFRAEPAQLAGRRARSAAHGRCRRRAGAPDRRWRRAPRRRRSAGSRDHPRRAARTAGRRRARTPRARCHARRRSRRSSPRSASRT